MRLVFMMLSILVVTSSTSQATDLSIKAVRFPWGELRSGQAAEIAVLVANENILPAESWTVRVQIQQQSTMVYDQIVDAPPIQPFTEAEIRLPLVWTPMVTGPFNMTATVEFADEIDPSDNVASSILDVRPPLLLSSLFRRIVQAPYQSSDSRNAEFQLRYAGDLEWRYLNVRALTVENAWTWLVRNKPIPPRTDSVTMVHPVDLSVVLGPLEPDSLRCVFDLSADTLASDTGMRAYTTLAMEDRTYTFGGVSDTGTVSISIAGNTTTPRGGVHREGLIIGCTMPNIDLNNTAYGPGSLADYAGDLNACAPAAAANSLQWLDDSWSDIETGQSHRARLIELSRMMLRPNETGVWSEDFLAAKLEYINKYDLPISVKFQRRGSTEDVESQDDYLATADNQGDGGYPRFDWVLKEVQDSEDVEVFVEYHEDGGTGSTIKGRHVMVLSGATRTSSSSELWYKDDGAQEREGGTEERTVTWDTLPGGIPYFEPWTGADGKVNITVPFAIFSESRDTSVHRKGRGRLDRLGRWLYGAVVGKRSRPDWDESVDNVDLTPLRFANLITISPTPVSHTVIPVGGGLGESVATLMHPEVLGVDSTNTSTLGAIWYADTLLSDTNSLRVRFTEYSWGTVLDSTRDAALGDGTERYVLPDSALTWDALRTGPLELLDSTLRWRHVLPMDLDSSATHERWSDSLSDYGSSGEATVGAVIAALASDSTFAMPDTGVDLRVRLSELSGRTPRGAPFRSLIEATVRYATNHDLPIRISFQTNASIPDSITAESIWAYNETGSNNAPDAEWMKLQLHSSPLLIAVGQYDATGRVGGWYALCVGWLSYNGIHQLILHRDVREGSNGGRIRAAQRIQQEGRYLVLPELARRTERAVIEGVVALRYHPTISSVGEDLGREIAMVSVHPNPTSGAVTVCASVTRSDEVDVVVVDITGREVLRQRISSNQLREGHTFVLPSVAGLYGVQIRTPHAMHMMSVVRLP